MSGQTKTNALRLLDAAGIAYSTREFDYNDADPCGTADAALRERMFKTLVARGDRRGLLVFCIPVDQELDLKKCAAAAGDKRVEMIHLKELLPLTGYIHGGCSPVGMKKALPTLFDETALLYDRIFVSAGQRGLQMEVAPEDLIAYVGADTADLIKT